MSFLHSVLLEVENLVLAHCYNLELLTKAMKIMMLSYYDIEDPVSPLALKTGVIFYKLSLVVQMQRYRSMTVRRRIVVIKNIIVTLQRVLFSNIMVGAWH